MPFRADLNFFYLYLRQHLRKRHGLQVERADHRILTVPLLEKIKSQILAADLVIGDITGRNPNVFYELGFADAYSKPVILVTQDDAHEVPTDIRHLEFIRYDLSNDEDLIRNIDNAVHHVLIERYRQFFDRATELLSNFRQDVNIHCDAVTENEFTVRVVRGERTHGLPDPQDKRAEAEFLVPRILLDPSDIKTMRALTAWLDSRF